MKSCRNLLIGFFYPEAKQYFKYYFQSVNKQNTNNFELLILIDNTKFVVPRLKIKFHIIKVSKITSIISLRNIALKFAKNNNYKNIIFSDTDDFFSENRVSQSIKYLKKYDFVFNNIYKINEDNKVIKKNLYFQKKNNFSISKINSILKYNFIGFTNSAIRVKILKDIRFPRKIIALDWYLFSLMLLNNKKGYFLKNVISYYRAHNNNYVNEKISIDEIKKIILIKSTHYKNILKFINNDSNSNIYKTCSLLLNDLKKLNSDLVNEKCKDKFLKIYKQKSMSYKKGWWSEI